jgi:hypothetical protein
MHHPRLVIFAQFFQAIQHFVPRARPGTVVGEQVVYVGWALNVCRRWDRMRGDIDNFGGGVLGVFGYHHH